MIHSSPTSDFTTEADLLAAESDAARQAMARVAEQMKATLRRSADVRAWTLRYPWPMVGVAAASGIGAAAVVKSLVGPGKPRAQGAVQGTDDESATVAAEEVSAGAAMSAATSGWFWQLFSGLAAAAVDVILAAARAQLSAAFNPQQPAEEPQPE